jgi:hypothetical protein
MTFPLRSNNLYPQGFENKQNKILCLGCGLLAQEEKINNQNIKL